MRKPHTTRALLTAMLATALAALSLASSASAFSTEYQKFQYCPYKTTGVLRCLHSVTESGTVVLGSKKVPIVNPVTLQGGYGAAVEGFSSLVEPTNKITLSKTAQPLPGGLAGLVNCKEISNFLLRISCEVTFENGVTGVNTVLELANGASAVKLNEVNLRNAEGVALRMPVRVHLENPFLGSECYVGSASSPIIWELTAGVTNPKEPNKPIEGKTGEIEFIEGGRILRLNENSLVDNDWSAPGANGCGGIFSFLIDPILNLASGLPSSAGHNTAILNNTINISSAAAVKKDNEEHP